MTEPNKPRFSLLLLLGDGLLLLCAAVGLTVSFLSLYASAPAPLDQLAAAETGALCGWAVLFALLALGAWSLPRFRLPTAGFLAAVWLWGILLRWESFLLGAKLTVSAVSILFDQRVQWGLTYQFDCELTAAEQLDAVRLFLILALALLALILGWAIVRGRSWWMAVLFTLPPLFPGLLADLYPNWPAFMALCACWCTMLISDLCQHADPNRRGRLSLAVLPAVALVLAGLTLALPMEGYTRPAWTYTAQEALINWTSRLSHFFEGWDGPFRGITTYVGSAETVDLQNAGPLDYSGRTVLRVTSDYTGHLYLRGTSLAVYDGGRWTAFPDGVYQEYLDSIPNVHFPQTPLIFPALWREPEQTYTATVTNVGASGSCIYTPYQLVGQVWEDEDILPVEDAFLARRQGQWSQTTTFMPLSDALAPLSSISGGMVGDGEGEVVVVAGVGSAYDPITASASRQEPAYADYVWAHYLDVPEELRPVLQQFLADQELTSFYIMAYGSLSSSFYDPSAAYFPSHSGDVSSRYITISYASRVAEALNKLCEYDPATPLTPDGEDFVEYFLTESRQGYCMHFASAATLILRTMGIPARYVSGFTVDTVAKRQVDVPDWAAHAWVEIYLDGYGWYPIEVTPGYDWDGVFSTDAPNVSSAPSDQPSIPPEESEPPVPSDEPLPSQGPLNGPNGQQDEGSNLLPTLLRVLAALAGLAALLWLGQYLPKRLRAARQTGPDTNRAALYSYRCLLRLKRWGGDVDGQALELAQKARFSQHTLTDEERQTMADKVDEQRLRLCWRLHPVQCIVFRYWWGKPKR